MEEIEKHFKCPFCLEKISMLLDLSNDGEQSYIEDCEVCCNPWRVRVRGDEDGRTVEVARDDAADS